MIQLSLRLKFTLLISATFFFFLKTYSEPKVVSQVILDSNMKLIYTASQVHIRLLR